MRDTVVEARLKREGVEFEYHESVNLTDIDVAGSLRNQARFDPLTKTNVERYALKMIDGEEFPPIIVFSGPKGYTIVDGNHRVAAATEAERSTIDAYVLDALDPLTITRLTRTWNIGNGQGLTQAEVLEQAIYLVKNTPYTQLEVAKMVGMNSRTLGGHIRARDGKEKLYALGVAAESLSTSHLEALAQLKDDAVLAEAARLAIRANLPIVRVQSMVQDVLKGTSEPERLGIVKGWQVRARGHAAVSGGGRFTSVNRRANVVKLLNALNAVSRLCGRTPSAAVFGLVLAEDVEAVRAAYTESTNRLRRLMDSAAPAEAVS